MSQEDRGHLPSGSKFERIVACPGSHLLEQSIPPSDKEYVDPLASRGTRIHYAFQTGDTSELSSDEVADYEQGLKHLDLIVAQWQRDFGLDNVQEGPRESRYWLHHPDTMEPMASGQLDRYFIAAKHGRALLLDLKSGWATHVQRSPSNWQMRVYALALWEETGISNIRVAIDRAKSRVGFEDFTDYTEADLRYSRELFLMHSHEASMPDAPRYPGPHCFYCLGKPGCPQAAAYCMLPGIIAQQAAPDTRKAEEQVGMLADADLLKLWNADTIIRRVLDAVDTRLKSFPKERLAALGLELPENGRKLDPIVRVRECFQFLRDIQQLPEDKLWEAMSMSKGPIQAMIQESKMLTSKGAEGWISEALAEYIEKKNAAPSLRRLKE
jgi:hypothetical protein